MLFDDYFGAFFLLTVAYLIGSLPTAFFAVYFIKGSSGIRSGKIAGAYSVKNTIGLIPSLFVFLMDFFKGFCPIITATYLFPTEITMILTLSLLLIVGHNWSIFLRLSGGRGIAISLGTLLGLHLWQEVTILVILFGLIGKYIIHKDSALWVFWGIMLLPALLLFFERGLSFVIFGICLGFLLFVKRLFGDGKILDIRHCNWRVLTSRVVWDRDIVSKEQWRKESG